MSLSRWLHYWHALSTYSTHYFSQRPTRDVQGMVWGKPELVWDCMINIDNIIITLCMHGMKWNDNEMFVESLSQDDGSGLLLNMRRSSKQPERYLHGKSPTDGNECSTMSYWVRLWTSVIGGPGMHKSAVRCLSQLLMHGYVVVEFQMSSSVHVPRVQLAWLQGLS